MPSRAVPEGTPGGSPPDGILCPNLAKGADDMRYLAMTLFSLMATTIGTTDASAQGGPIHACVKAAGTMRIVSGPADCRANETPLSWSQQGPPGEPGEPGQPGEPGAPGDSGAQLSVFDANGTEIGPFTGYISPNSLNGMFLTVYLESVDAIVAFDTTGRLGVPVNGQGQVLYASADCRGQAYTVTGSPDNNGSLPGVLSECGPAGLCIARGPLTGPIDFYIGSPTACSLGGTELLLPLEFVTEEDLGLTLPLPAPPVVSPVP